MILFTLSFLVGILFLQSLSELPHMQLIIFLCILFPIILYFHKKFSIIANMTCGFLFGFIYTLYIATTILSVNLSPQDENVPILITGEITSIPLKNAFGYQFLFDISELKSQRLKKPMHVKLNWQTNDKVKVGDRWQFTVKLKRIHGSASFGAFDYESYAFANRLRATGSVLNKFNALYIANYSHHYPIEKFREGLYHKISSLESAERYSPWLYALVLGIKYNIKAEDWEVLRNTGTNHLMAIAGLHIGMIVFITHFFINYITNFFPRLFLKFPRQEISVIFSLVFGFFYALLSGFSVPAQRAFIMLMIMLSVKLMRSTVSNIHALCLALFIVLLINPNDLLSESIWLSFATIFFIFYGMSANFSFQKWYKEWFKLQMVMTLGLLPLTLYFYQQTSLVAFIANAFSVPLLGFVILPLLAVAFISLPISLRLADNLFLLASYVINHMNALLQKISLLPYAVWTHAILSSNITLITILGVVILLIPKGMAGRYLGVLFLLPAMFTHPKGIANNEFMLTVLDVGQGLATVVQTKHHVLIYDVGLIFNKTDMVQSILLPYLRIHAINKIDMVMISHGDNDHIGGLSSLINSVTIHEIKSSDLNKIAIYQKNTRQTVSKISECLQGENWIWDGVQFEMLSPAINEPNIFKKNDRSCVLKISGATYSALLPGDIEKIGEQYLINHQEKTLSADVMIAPHHGSKTSAENMFIEKVAPKFVVYSTGYLNRYHFPHREVIATYNNKHIAQVNTVQTGTLEIYAKDGTLNWQSYRELHKHFW